MRIAHHFLFDPHVEDLMRRRYGLAQSWYHPLWDGGLPSPQDGITSCMYLVQVVMGDYLQGHPSVFHYSDMYLNG